MATTPWRHSAGRHLQQKIERFDGHFTGAGETLSAPRSRPCIASGEPSYLNP